MPQPVPEPRPSLGATEQVHDLDTIRVAEIEVRVRLETRREGDGTWRGRMRFAPSASLITFVTGDIFRGSADADLLVAAKSLREHHLRDLYRSLQPDAT